jgi:RHS repeat-associated protein
MSSRSTPSATTSYAWDTRPDLPELATETVTSATTSQTSSYSYGAGPIGIIKEAGSYNLHTDSLGSVVELSDASGNSVASYRYSPYGEAEASSSSPIRYAGQYLDSESDLYYLRAREYEPETGRFLEVDPLECDMGGSCGSTYTYVDNRPTVMTDPNGECATNSGGAAAGGKSFMVTDAGLVDGLRGASRFPRRCAASIISMNHVLITTNVMAGRGVGEIR